MVGKKPIVISIAGLDPSGGAGVTADVKTIHQLGGYSFSVLSANTIQNDTEFLDCHWMPASNMISQLHTLSAKFNFAAVKIGIVESWQVLYQLVLEIRKISPDVPIVVDPVLKASAGFTFHATNPLAFFAILEEITLITPNLEELQALSGTIPISDTISQLQARTHVLVKGGHDVEKKGTDTLYLKNGGQHVIAPSELKCFAKHGSGCVLSSAIATYLAHGDTPLSACTKAKKYTEQFLNSNPSLLGFHE